MIMSEIEEEKEIKQINIRLKPETEEKRGLKKISEERKKLRNKSLLVTSKKNSLNLINSLINKTNIMICFLQLMYKDLCCW